MVPPGSKPHIAIARSPEHGAIVQELFLEYAQSLGFSLCFQGFDVELASLPGCYAAPTGALLLAAQDGLPAGCVGLRALPDGTCEMKRLYTRPAFRRTGLGRALAEAVIIEARRIGYRTMRLDTLATMGAARQLYRSLGFRDIPPYYENPIPGAEYLELALAGYSRLLKCSEEGGC